MISYCIAVYRPTYARLLLEDLVQKTTARYEILVWLNVQDTALDAAIAAAQERGVPLRIVGRTPHNIGMCAYRELFRASRYPLIVQIDDDVICVSRRISERAGCLFEKFPRVRQLVADVWQDEFTTGARPPLDAYRCVDAPEGLYDGPIDGWFSIYHRSVLPVLLSLPYSQYCCLGAMVRSRLSQQGLSGLLCTRMKVFHVIGPQYAALFGMLEFELEKYRRLGRSEIVDWYSGARTSLPPAERLEEQFAGIARSLEADGIA
jgi:hypothetical protein